MRDQRRPAAGPEPLTDDEAQLVWERQRLTIALTKLAAAETTIDRWYYTQCAAGWRRSIRVLEQRVANETIR